jgi:hypothetical protein
MYLGGWGVKFMKHFKEGGGASYKSLEASVQGEYKHDVEMGGVI